MLDYCADFHDAHMFTNGISQY